MVKSREADPDRGRINGYLQEWLTQVHSDEAVYPQWFLLTDRKHIVLTPYSKR